MKGILLGASIMACVLIGLTGLTPVVSASDNAAQSETQGAASLPGCGNVNGDPQPTPTILDVVYLIDWLWKGGAPPPDLNMAECDDHHLLTMSDVMWLVKYIFIMGPEPICPASNPSLDQIAVPRDSVFLTTYQDYLPYPAILPPGETEWDIDIHFVTDVTIDNTTFPIAVKVAGQPAQVTAVTHPPQCTEYYQCRWGGNFDPARGVAGVGYYSLNPLYDFSPGVYHVMTVSIEVDPLADGWRPVTIEWDSLSPVQDGRYVHQPWVVDIDQNVWKPYIYRFPCVGMRGNVNGDAADQIDITDLTYLVDYFFGKPSGPPPRSFEEADFNASLVLDITDLTDFTDYMFGSGAAPQDCPPEP